MSAGRVSRGPTPVYVAKGIRVFVSGLLSIVIPFYLRIAGYGIFFQGLALVAILAGNAASNIAVTYLDWSGRKRLLQGFSLLMVASGVILASNASPALILAACFIGNISSTGTEAGPFQSIEAGTLPELAGTQTSVNAFARYNFIGYSAAAVGQLASAGPGLLGNSLDSFRVVFVGFALVGAALFLIYSRLDAIESGRSTRPGLANLSPQARKDTARLSGLFLMDAFGGVFVTTYLLSIWFNVTYGLQLEALGSIFFVAALISAGSVYAAASIARRLGNLRTMVYTHLVSNALLIMMGLAGALLPAVSLLFLRQSLSQMDVPTRQALMTEMFQKEERVQAYAVTNTLRSTGSFFAGPVAAGILGLGAISAIPFAGGGVKVIYDLATYFSFRKRYR
ncbi:MAG: MFS transporter [Nitrososphaerota archaeon]|nr:MFS transporter [Nitrososphaerota archaeon]